MYSIRLLTSLLVVMLLTILCLGGVVQGTPPGSLSVKGAVSKSLSLSFEEIRKMPSFSIKNVALLREKQTCEDKDALIDEADYTGVLLRDLLEKAGMKHVRKREPGVYIRVRNASGQEVVFSFGEIFYSSIGRSVLLAYEKDGKSLTRSHGCADLVVATDIRAGRNITDVNEIIVERVDVKLKAYQDKARKVVRPPHFAVFRSRNRDGDHC